MNYKVHPKEKGYLIFMSCFSAIIYMPLLFMPFETTGGLILMSLGFFILGSIIALYLIGEMKGNGIKISRKQFPEVFEILEDYSAKLDLNKVPDMYLIQGNGILNAFATKFAKRNYIVLHSDILEMAYQEGLDAVSFIIGHELGHIKRNHMGFFKRLFLLPAHFIPLLAGAYSRACEYTCDNIGYSLCPEGALKGALILASGKKLYKKVNIDALIFNSMYDLSFAVTFAEIFSTHPALTKRIAAIRQLDQENNQENNIEENTSFVSPNFEVEQLEKQIDNLL